MTMTMVEERLAVSSEYHAQYGNTPVLESMDQKEMAGDGSLTLGAACQKTHRP